MDELESLAEAIVELEEEKALELTERVLASGDKTPAAILAACQRAMRVVGERYERREYYLSALILAGEIFKEVLDLVRPDEDQPLDGGSAGVVLLGTVAGDIHDIGKNLFSTALRGFGFSVIDLGVNVPKERFLEEARRSRPDVICMSGLITAAFRSMKATVELLRADESALGYAPPVVLGGGTVDDQVCRYAGADSWSTDAAEGVRICQRLVRGPRSTTD
jgi:methanogenic corrinoid protein MtbC1